jgi:hypothetical protein
LSDLEAGDMGDPIPGSEDRFDEGARRVDVSPESAGFLPASPPRASIESVVVRLIATAGVVGIGTALGALLSTGDVGGWIIALVVSLVSVVLAGTLWRSRRL